MGPYIISKKKLNHNRYLVIDIRGHQFAQKLYESVSAAEKIKP